MSRYLPEPAPNELAGLIDAAVRAVSLPAALAILGVHRTTLMRWRTGQTRVPLPALALLRVWADGKLPGMSSAWDGFRFDGDNLSVPGGASYGARDILAWHWKQQHLDACQRRVKQLEKVVYDQARRLDMMGGAANDISDPINPPPRPRRSRVA